MTMTTQLRRLVYYCFLLSKLTQVVGIKALELQVQDSAQADSLNWKYHLQDCRRMRFLSSCITVTLFLSFFNDFFTPELT